MVSGNSDNSTLKKQEPYMAPDRQAYLLPRNESENDRLSRQHRMVVKALDGKLLYHGIEIPSSGTILDTATGNGVWLIDLFTKTNNSRIQYQGSDISDANFPKTSLPDNVSFTTHDMLEPVKSPSTYSLINQRFLCMALSPDQFKLAIQHNFDALSSGGHLQLVEMNPLEVDNSGKAVTGPIVHQILSNLFSRSNKNPELILKQTETWLKQAGFIDIDVEFVPYHWGAAGQHLGQDYVQDTVYNAMDGLSAVKGICLALGGADGIKTPEEFDAFLLRHREFMLDIGLTYKLLVATARKP